MITYRVDPFPPDQVLRDLWSAAWGDVGPSSFAPLLRKSLTHLCAYADDRLVGFVNLAGDGGKHAMVLDTTVHPAFRRQGIGVQLVTRAAGIARERHVIWLHVDYEEYLAPFYRHCGFAPTTAGLMKLSGIRDA